MDTKQLITGSPKEGFYPIVQDTVTVIELNEAVMNLTSESSSEDIAAAFDSAASFNTLIEQIRDTENIVNGILMNNDGSVGKIICTIAAYKNQYACDIEYIYDSKIIRLDITNTDGTLSCTRTETELGGGSQNNIKYISLNNIPDGTGTVNEDIITTLNTLQDRDILIGILDESKVAVVINYYMVNSKFYGYCVLPNWANAESIVINSLIINLNTKESSWNGVSIDTNGDGSKFLSDDGKYKTIEIGDKTNVLILSLENDLANGQKDSPVESEVSTALKDAISNGKACVIKSANSDILANLQQIGDNVTIVMEQISRVEQTFVAVNTSITVNTATNVISDYQTGAIVLETDGDGNKFLSNNGEYKSIDNKPVIIRYDDIIEDESHINNIIETVTNAYKNNKPILLNDTDTLMPLTSYNYISNILSISFIRTALGSTTAYSFEINGNDYLIAKNREEVANYKDFLTKDNASPFTPTGDYQPATKKYVDDKVNIPIINAEISDTDDDITGDYILNIPNNNTQVYLVNLGVLGYVPLVGYYVSGDKVFYYRYSGYLKREDGTGNKMNNALYYVTINGTDLHIELKQLILTESEYSALGTTPETDDVLYFITPD